MASETDYLSLIASVVSAIGGAFAARAAYLSAASAREAKEAAEAAETRLSLREISTTAAGVLLEVRRVEALVDQVKLQSRSLAILSGNHGGSRQQLFADAAETKRSRARALAQDSELFANGANSLAAVDANELERVLLRQTTALRDVQGLREDLEREHLSLEKQGAEIRESMDRTRLAK